MGNDFRFCCSLGGVESHIFFIAVFCIRQMLGVLATVITAVSSISFANAEVGSR